MSGEERLKREQQDAQQLFRGALESYGVPADVIEACWKQAFARGRIRQIDLAIARQRKGRKRRARQATAKHRLCEPCWQAAPRRVTSAILHIDDQDLGQ